MTDSYRDPRSSHPPTDRSDHRYSAAQPPIYAGDGWTPQPQPTGDEKSMAVIAHLSTLVAMIISVGWLSFVGPLIVWLFYKDRSDFVRRCAAGALNFNVSMWIINVIGWILTITVVGAIIGIPMLIFSFVMQLWGHIRAAIKANRGEVYRYPFQLRILR